MTELSFSERGAVFVYPQMTHCPLVYFAHHCEISEIGNRNYRFKQIRKYKKGEISQSNFYSEPPDVQYELGSYQPERYSVNHKLMPIGK